MPSISLTDPLALIVIAIGFALGGILKGATGAGMPVIVVPVIAAFYDVRLAVVILVIPNFIINVLQLYRFRAHELSRGFSLQFVLSGMSGAVVGTLILVALPTEALNILMSLIIFVYIGLRLLRPDFQISRAVADRTAWMAGGAGGVLQGALGISAPIAVTFLNAVKLPRPNFIFTASLFFAGMCIPQMALQLKYGLMTSETVVFGLIAVIPLMAALPVGEWIGKRMSAKTFDRAILGLLAILAIKQLVQVVFW